MKKSEAFKTLLASQLRYGWPAIAIACLTYLTFGLSASFVADSVRGMGKIWAVLTLLAGLGTTMFYWITDIRERRVLGWLPLAVTPGTIATARLAVPVVTHLCVIVIFVSSSFFWLDSESPDAWGVFSRVLGMHAFSLATSTVMFLVEELTVRVRRWGVKGVIGLNILFAGGLIGLPLLLDFLGLPDLDSFPGMVAGYLAATLFAVLTVVLYIRRANYLLGIDVCTSMPVDWSAARG